MHSLGVNVTGSGANLVVSQNLLVPNVVESKLSISPNRPFGWYLLDDVV